MRNFAKHLEDPNHRGQFSEKQKETLQFQTKDKFFTCLTSETMERTNDVKKLV